MRRPSPYPLPAVLLAAATAILLALFIWFVVAADSDAPTLSPPELPTQTPPPPGYPGPEPTVAPYPPPYPAPAYLPVVVMRYEDAGE